MAKRPRADRRSGGDPARASPTVPAVWRSPFVRTALLLGLLAVALYARSWRYGFAGDDAFVITGNAWTQEGLSALPKVVAHSLYYGAHPVNGGLYRPVAGAYYVVVGALTGRDAAGYHLAQLGLYALNVITVFVFFDRLRPRAPGAPAVPLVPVVATCLFLVHPIHTEVVNNIKSADELLCLQFMLVAGVGWLAYADSGSTRWRTLAWLTYALAVGAKETAVPLVIVWPALWYVFRGRSIVASLRAALPFGAIALAYVGLRVAVLHAEPATPIVTVLNNALLATEDRGVRLASALAYLGRYLRMLVWPYPLSFDYSYNAIPLRTFGDPVVWLAVASLAALAGVAAVGWRRRRVEAFALIWVGAGLIAVSNLVVLVSTNFGERLLYLPSVLVCYVAAAWLCRAAQVDPSTGLTAALRTPALAAPLAVVVGLAALYSGRRTFDWRDQIALFAADVRTFPQSARLQAYYGHLLYLEGERLLGQPGYSAIATEDLRRAVERLQRSLQILDRFQEPHAAIGMAQYRLGECAAALPNLERGATLPSQRPVSLEMMADCYTRLSRPAEALATWARIDAEGLRVPRAWFELANDASARGDTDRSIVYFSKFISAEPKNVAARYNIASAYLRRGDYPQALAEADACAALEATPQVASRCLLFGADALVRMGRAAESTGRFERARALDPANPWLRNPR